MGKTRETAGERAKQESAALARGLTVLLNYDGPVPSGQEAARNDAKAIKMILAATPPGKYIILPWERLGPLGFTALNVGRVLSRMVAEGRLTYSIKGWRRPKADPES